MVKKIICEFEDVKEFERFYFHNDCGIRQECIKVPLLELTIEENPVPWDLRTKFDWKANAIQTRGMKDYIFIEPNTEVIIYPSESEDDNV